MSLDVSRLTHRGLLQPFSIEKFDTIVIQTDPTSFFSALAKKNLVLKLRKLKLV